MSQKSVEEKLRALKETQKRWLKERAADSVRQDVVAELKSQHSPVTSERVLTEVTAQLSDKLRLEIRKDLEREQQLEQVQKAAIHGRMEKFLAAEIESQTCPICFEIMESPQKTPIMLFPCGHTFCCVCIKSVAAQARARTSCPYCRAVVQSQAPNVALQQVISAYVTKLKQQQQQQQQQRPGTAQSTPAVAAADATVSVRDTGAPDLYLEQTLSQYAAAENVTEAMGYLREYRTYGMRCRVLQSELNDTAAQTAAVESEQRSANLVLQHLQSEEAQLVEAIARLQQELQMVQTDIGAQQSKIESLAQHKEETLAKMQLLQKTLQPLQTQRKKSKFLLRNFAPRMPLSDDEQ